jgi:hypothetical protein
LWIYLEHSSMIGNYLSSCPPTIRPLVHWRQGSGLLFFISSNTPNDTQLIGNLITDHHCELSGPNITELGGQVRQISSGYWKLIMMYIVCVCVCVCV